MHGGTGVATDRTELLVVLLIAVAGITAAAAVALTPWHPTTAGRHRETSTVIQLRSPQHHIGRHDQVRADRR